jgi:hypothetical protein
VLVLGVALLEYAGMIREVAGAVDVAEPTAAEAGISAPIGKAVVAKARAAPGEAAAAEPAAAVEATEAATAESATAKAAANGVVSPDREADGEGGSRQQCGQPLPIYRLPGHGILLNPTD